MRFENFLVPVGIDFMAEVAAAVALALKFGYILPCPYRTRTFLRDDSKERVNVPAFQPDWLAIRYAALFTISGYRLSVSKRQKG